MRKSNDEKSSNAEKFSYQMFVIMFRCAEILGMILMNI